MEALVSYLTSGQEWSLFTEEFEQDLSFERTKAVWDNADSALAPEEQLNRQQANYAGALYRDARYAHAGRNYLLKQGHHNAFRELYEGGKVSIDNERAWKKD